jgi:hypothetical protein
MGFSSDDDLIAQITANGKRLRVDGLSKVLTPVHTAGGWHLLAGLSGFPNAGAFPGTDLLWASCSDGAGDGATIIGQPNGGVLGGSASKHLSMLGAMVVAAAGAPWQLKLVDLQGYYRLSTTNVTGTGSRVLVNTNTFTADAGTDLLTYTNDFKNFTKVRFTTSGTLPAGLSLATDYWLVRQSATTALVASSYANAVAGTTIDITSAGTGTHTLTIQMPRATDGAGCEAFFVVQTAPTGGGPNLTASDYTNPAGTTARAFQGSPSMGAAADAYAARVIHSGNAAGRYGPFLPKHGADNGIARINSFTFSGGTAYTGTGVLALCIAKPIADIMLPATGACVMEDLRNQLPSLPKIEDGACLVPMLFGTGATTNNSPVNWITDFVWGG